ncbi:IS1 family transposase [Sorangium sp. So ce1097]|uniref:IS1 family transposase n=1 Tax=Sorangium sp. So ce1097 TaxID=3133330 RepID=UPI003F5E9688
MANVLPRERQLAVLAALVDGNSERAAERMTGVSRPTINRFALLAGQGAARLHNRRVRDLSCSLITFDELWGWVAKKPHRVDPAEDAVDVGEGWIFAAIDVSSRLCVSFYVGKRDQESTDRFIEDLRARLVVMPQLMTSDGFAPYVSSVGTSFGPSSTFAQTVKHYRKGSRRGPDHRYEPPRDPFIVKRAVFGAPDMAKASTAHSERLNLTMRHVNGRLRRLCLAFSKKMENHRAAVALAYTHYNFCHVVKTLRVTPAMQAGITDHVWGLEELLDALMSDAPSEKPIARPLAHVKPEGATRELPAGRGFLRVVQGSAAPSPPAGPAPHPPAPVPVAATQSAHAPVEPTGQLDLLSWRPKPRKPVQLSLFGDPPGEEQT